MESSKEVKFSDEVTIVFNANHEPSSPPATRVARTIPTDEDVESDHRRSTTQTMKKTAQDEGPQDHDSVTRPTEKPRNAAENATIQSGDPGNDRDTLEKEPAKPLSANTTAVTSELNSKEQVVHKLETPGSSTNRASKGTETQPEAKSTSSPATASEEEAKKQESGLAARPTNETTTSRMDDPVVEEASALSAAEPADPSSSSEVSAFSPYVVEGETIDDARHRLLIALKQTRSLCKSFTDRVYSKYRVCLYPVDDPDVTLQKINSDPKGFFEKVSHEMQVLKEEKDGEKKEAIKLQAELATVSTVASSLDLSSSSEQLLYYTAGLNLIILPEEDVDPSFVAGYSERGPYTHGERARGISQAAATAGDVMLDRARKAAALRIERHKQERLQRLSGEAPQASSLEVLNTATVAAAAAKAAVRTSAAIDPGSTTAASISEAPVKAAATTPRTESASKKVPSSKGGKGAAHRPGFARSTQSAVAAASATLSTSTLLSVTPLSDQISTTNGKLLASTSALTARSCIQKTTQQRLKHPHPDSMGGRRRTNSSKKDEVFLQAYLALTLPPLPSTRERQERKPLPVCSEPTDRAVQSVRGIMKLFDKGKPTTKIRLLNGMRQLSETALSQPDANKVIDGSSQQASADSIETATTPQILRSTEDPSFDSTIDPILTFSVLQAIGLVSAVESTSATQQDPTTAELLPAMDANCPVWSKKLKTLQSKISNATLTDRLLTFNSPEQQEMSPRSDSITKEQECIDQSLTLSKSEEVPVESIRGGGDSESANEEVSDSGNEGGRTIADDTPANVAARHDKPATSEGTSEKPPGKRKYSDPALAVQPPQSRRKYSDPGMNIAAPAATEVPQMPQMLASQLAAVGQFGGAYGQSAAMNALHLANQLRNMQHPAGELADYIGNLNQRTAGYDISSLLQASASGPLAGISLMQSGVGLVGFDGARMFSREQQAAALLSSATFPQAASPYGHVSSYPAAVSALLGSTSSLLHGHGPYSLTGSQMHAPQPPSHTQPVNVPKPAESKGPETATKGTIDTTEHKSIGAPSSAKLTPASQTLEKTRHDDRHVMFSDQATSSPDQQHPKPPPKPESRPQQGQVESTRRIPLQSRTATLPIKNSDQIKGGKFDHAIADLSDESKFLAIDFLAAAAAVVPIPKALVWGPLKEKLNTPGFKNSGSGGAPNVPRDVIVSVILVWLWANHEKDFQEAFHKSGRYDVDQGCNWLIQTAIETAVRALALDIAESLARGQGPFAGVAVSRKAQGGQKNSSTQDNESENPDSLKKLDLHAASLVNRALSAELQIDERMDRAIPQFQSYVEYLDEARLCALRAKAQERVMLATLISRKATMSEPFAHAYVSSIVRAGEAIGHENLFENVQDADTQTSSLMPYDILTAEGDLWEEPCKPEGNFTASLTGDDLMRRAHARAMLQKSLRKLQERNHIRGGTHSYGPYAALSSRDGSAGTATSEAAAAAPRAGSKRKAATFGEPQAPAGTGSARAKTWSVYEPNHYSLPLEWQTDHSENMPYGLHRIGERVRALSLTLSARSGEPRSIKKARRSSSFTAATSVVEKVKPEDGVPKSTREINWADIAGIFQSVELPRKSPPNKSGERGSAVDKGKSGGDGSVGKTIYAPYCRKIDPEALPDDESESEDEEDVSDEKVLAQHQLVLETMKARHAAFLEARKKQQERRKSKSNKY